MKKNVTVIGYGGQGGWHANHAQNSDVISLLGVYDIDEKKNELARERGLKCTAGSDGHHVDSCARAGIATQVRAKDMNELISLMKAGDYELYTGEEK